jgi:hypothetical protein
MEIFEKYQKEAEEDCKLNRFNVMEKTLTQPAIRHKWIARLINHKITYNKLKALKIKKREEYLQKIIDESPVNLSKVTIDKKIDKLDLIKNINKKIEEQEMIILYLEKLEQSFKTMGYDIGHIVDLIKLEET